MDPSDENEITKLLRLKRYEQPPPRYIENFIHEFHRRQRDELLRQPLWRICFDRTRDFVLGFNLASLTSYPVAATAVMVCAAVLSLKLYQTPVQSRVAVQDRPVQTFTAPAPADEEWTLASPVATRVFSTKSLHSFDESAHTHRAGTPPRYVLDSVPVSYETTFKF